MAELELILAGIAIASAGGSIVWGYSKGNLKTAERFAKLHTEVSELTVKLNIIWKIFEQELPKLLIRPTHKEMDELIEKYVEHQATKEDLEKLRDMIDEELKSSTDAVTKLKLSFIKPVLDHNIEHFR